MTSLRFWLLDCPGKTRQGLSDWRKKGAPQISRGKWDIQALMNWRYGTAQDDNPMSRKLKAEADIKEAKAEQEKIKLGIKQEEFVSTEFVRNELTRLFANIKNPSWLLVTM